MQKFVLLSLAALLLFFSNCSNELKTDADRKEIMIIYGLLNSADTVQYIRVSRAFLTNGQSALEIAKISDSLYFDSVKVRIDEYEINSAGQQFYKGSFDFYRTTSQAKDPGIFANEPNVVYALNYKVKDGWLYKLEVTNLRSGNKANAEDRVVGPPTPNTPSAASTNYDIDTILQKTINWAANPQAKLYDFTMRLYWDEYDINTNALLDSNVYVDWNVVQDRDVPQTGSMISRVPGYNFYDFLGQNIPVKPNVYRIPKKFDFYYWAADNEYYIYKSVNTPSIGIVQKKPEYTNLTGNNYGLFASRNFYGIYNTSIALRTRQNLQHYHATLPLNFRAQ